MRRWGIALLALIVLLLAGSGAQAERDPWPVQFPALRVCCHGLLGDANGDGWVNALDFSVMNAAYDSAEGDTHYNARADLTCDGRIDGDDLNVLQVMYWKRTPAQKPYGVFLPLVGGK
jgi:hypothetical protein